MKNFFYKIREKYKKIYMHKLQQKYKYGKYEKKFVKMKQN